MVYTPYEKRGHVNDATYELVQIRPDGTRKVISFNEHVLEELSVNKSEWRDAS